MPSAAREYLTLLRTLPAENIGPHRMFVNPAVDSVRLSELGKQVTADVKRLDERTYEAPSPWHAAAWMMDLAAIVGQVAEVDADTGFHSPFSAKLGAPVFRGQRDPSWRLEPTLLREPRNPENCRALECFVKAARELFEIVADETRMNSRFVHLAAAQHYGLATPLLDFTADPRVAVYFACDGAQVGQDQTAVVYFTPFNVLSDIAGAVILPPQWVKRLYAQRGLFLDCQDVPADLDLRDFFGRILFPPDQTFCGDAFAAASDVLLPADPWYECAIDWALQLGRNGNPDDLPGATPDILKGACGEPPFMWHALMPESVKESMDGLQDICEWLALKNVKGTWRYDLEPIQRMWQHNEPLFRNYRVTWQFFVNQFGDEEALRQNRFLGLLEAITKSVD